MMVTRILELGTMLVVTGNRRTLRRKTISGGSNRLQQRYVLDAPGVPMVTTAEYVVLTRRIHPVQTCFSYNQTVIIY
jgi:hypothetical protein